MAIMNAARQKSVLSADMDGDVAAMQLLTAALRHHFDSSAALPAWSSVEVLKGAVDLALRNKVAWHVGSVLGQGEFAAVFKNYSIATSLHNELTLERTSELISFIRGTSKNFILIKGPVQQYRIYNTYYVRPSSDIDLVVSKSDFLKVRRKIEAFGFELLSRSIWWWAFLGEQHLVRSGAQRVSVDLHHQLHQPGVPGLRDHGELFRQAEFWDWRGKAMPILTRQHIALLLAISICKALLSRERNAGHITDLFALLIPDAPKSVNSLLTSAARQGLTGHARVALRLVDLVFGTRLLPADRPMPLAAVDDMTLLTMAMMPDASFIVPPRRRTLITSFCDENPSRAMGALAFSYTAEIALRLFEKGPGEHGTQRAGGMQS
jgi:hypothetical protein